LVARLVDQEMPAGTHRVVWDGTDGRGHGLSSGTYLCRLAVAGQGQTVKMLLVR
jgi:hypothetical protein